MNIIIFNKNENNPTSPVVLKDKEGQAHTCLEELIDIMTEHMTEMMAPNGHKKQEDISPKATKRQGPPKMRKDHGKPQALTPSNLKPLHWQEGKQLTSSP
jgi:hypothetical protein